MILTLALEGALVVFFIYFGLSALSLGFSKRSAPFISLPESELKKLLEKLELDDESIFYDLGSGDGRVLLAAQDLAPQSTITGVEKNLLPYLISLWKRSRCGSGHIVIVHASFEEVPLTDATHLFAFLQHAPMQELRPKLERELREGAKLLSVSFPIIGMEPTKTFTLNTDPSALIQKAYLYTF